MKPLKAIIVDDEPLAINILKNYSDQIQELQLERTFTNAVEASLYQQSHPVDLIFLDINMPRLNGLEFMKTVQKDTMVVITTAYKEYAVKSYELEAIDYLLKPFPFSRFMQTVNRAIALRCGKYAPAPESNIEKDKESIFVKVDKKRIQKIYLDQIMVVESLKDYIRIRTADTSYIVHTTLGSFTEELPATKFIRIHRSYSVSIDKVEAVEGNMLHIGNERYTIGRSYLSEVKERILDGQFM
ncbi:LytR/AlgR family response regulator transcription factor [Zeaxanthinibacter enoshimensis]|uniref:DNA-binding LytR/AlgR family response regulator n=1 Tax=Zeaxanthinibacter enoshimensis TaxID=392009 RepID=A0A4R6TMT8_9FLAO|nr:LytTR family DNA-binding domain-containing protein [Zeaxanthinibacter enoshimensis]TDQ31049.1 DNA-binding LytR/AlgR family response regulator [Zeaxanthinibacter enoshimensis]